MKASMVMAAVMAVVGIGAAVAQRGGEAWGMPDRDVSIRARVEKRLWKSGETPQVVLDLSLGKVNNIAVARMPAMEVEVDGAWYVSRLEQPVAGYIEMHGGNVWEKYTAARLDDRWVARRADYRRGRTRPESDPEKRLKLSDGKHTLRIKCHVDGRDPISNKVEIEMAGK